MNRIKNTAKIVATVGLKAVPELCTTNSPTELTRFARSSAALLIAAIKHEFAIFMMKIAFFFSVFILSNAL